MPFAAAILTEGLFALDLAEGAIDLKIEQRLGESTRYTLRLEVDIAEREFPLLLDPRLRPGRDLAFLVRDEPSLLCLCKGPIDRVRVHFRRGGSGSVLEVMGGDRRVEMDRAHRIKARPGADSLTVTEILQAYGLRPDVVRTEKVYSSASVTQNQSASDEAFVQRLARRNGAYFWIDYETVRTPLGAEITEIGRFRPVPPRPEIGGGAGGPGSVPDPLRALTINQRGGTDTIDEFTVEVDIERPTRIVGVRVGEELTQEESSGAFLPPHVPLGPVSLQQYAGPAERSTFLATAGDAAELKIRAEATLSESEWFVHAQTKTTRYALGGRVLVPAKIVPVFGLGSVYSGDHLVAAVTHTIDHDQHQMELELRRNALGSGALSP